MRALLLFLLIALAAPAHALTRSQAQKRLFAVTHQCPTTGQHLISCPGYVIDHVIPLCAGGPDKASNMQWQTLRASYAKDIRERAYCKCLRATPAKVCTL